MITKQFLSGIKFGFLLFFISFLGLLIVPPLQAYMSFLNTSYIYSTGFSYTGNGGFIDSIWGNPAGLFTMKGSQLQLDYGSFLTELEKESPRDLIFNSGISFPSLGFAIASGIASRSVASLYSFYETRLAFAFQPASPFQFGLGFQYYLEKFSSFRIYSSSFGINAGILFPLNDQVHLGYLFMPINKQYLNRIGLKVKILNSFNGLIDYEFGTYSGNANIYLGLIYIVYGKIVLNVNYTWNMVSFSVRLLNKISAKYSYITYTDSLGQLGTSSIFGVTLQVNELISGDDL